ISSEEIFVPADISYEEIQKAINLKPLKICPGMDIKQDTTPVKIALNVLVLNNKKEKKPVSGADVKMVSKGLPDYNAKSDADGHINGITLQAEKSYQLVATANGKSGKEVVFNTIGVKGAKIYDKTIYVEKNPEDEVSFPLTITTLNNKKQRVPVANASVKVTGTDGSTFDGKTDSKGKLKGITLNPETNYEINVEKDGVKNNAVVSTQHLRKSKPIEKTIFIEGTSETPDNSSFKDGCFTFHFKYNMNEVDESAPQYKQFIDSLVSIKNAGQKIVLNLNASASTVPTRKFKTNEELAQVRAKAAIEKIKNSLKLRGIADDSIVIGSNTSKVDGPAYKGDYIENAAEYEKYQFIRACIAK
ncbi:MAG TPA: hypothetical protein VKG26_04405, partial [Bacteroidia bacterium]|nr:hypothetical protein [Bacteroidia bacterium]